MDFEMEEMISLLPVFINFQVERDREIFYFKGLINDFPEIDILETLKNFLAWILDNPDKYDKERPTFHRRFRQWCVRASKSAALKNLKGVEGNDRETYNIRHSSFAG